jgi:hypothetical protein
MFITFAIGKLHVGLAWDIRVILFSKKIPPKISWKWTRLWFWSRSNGVRTIHQCPAQLTICLTLVPFDRMQQVMTSLTWAES